MHIVTIKEHRHLGYILALYMVEPSVNGEFLIVKEAVVAADVKRYPERYTDTQKQIALLADEYSDTNITKNYGGKKITNPQLFFSSHDEKYINEYVRPFVDKKIIKILEICRAANIGIYFKDPKQKHILTEDRADFASQNAQVVFNFERTDTETRYYLTAKYKNQIINLLGKNLYVLSSLPCVCIINNRILYFDTIDAKKLAPFTTKKYIPVLKRVEEQYYQKFIKNVIAENYIVKASGFDIVTQDITPKAVLFVERDLTGFLIFVLKFRYNTIEFSPSSTNHIVVNFYNNNGNYYFTKLERDIELETETEKAVTEILGNHYQSGVYRIKHESNDPKLQEAMAINCLNNCKERLIQVGVEIEQNIVQKNYYTGKIALDFKVKKRTDWFDIYAIVKLEDLEIPFISLKYYIINNIREFTLPDGCVVILPEEWFESFHDLFVSGNINYQLNCITLKYYQYSALMALPLDIDSRQTVEKLEESLNNFDKLPMKAPQNINATLRPYQITAYNWLVMMRDFGFGACLADDMGLGKTLCTLSLLANSTVYQANSNYTNTLFDIPKKTPSLLIVPKSLIYNWIKEAQKFAPQLKILEYSGTARTANIRNFNYYDIVISGYSILRNDIERFENIDFNYVVLDESQVIKNSASKTYTAIMQLRCKHRLTLTGTPLENSLTDLWSQMNFINPNILGSLPLFKKRFVGPIERNNDNNASEKLHKLIFPFILRRTKQQVLSDLPEKIEQVIYCEMGEEQEQFYEREKSKTRNAILEFVEQGVYEKSAVAVLQGLTRLRQIACSPYLLQEDFEGNSGKTDEIMLALQNVVAQGHKVLVFSSFVQHLQIIGTELRKLDLEYAMLTGATDNREKEVNRFTNNNEVSVFLISIKAGGTGLNLTSADYVFIIDPWWNPAVEEQAIARAHRIGQKNSVMVYRFIAKNTVEEKIQTLQQRKAGLATEFVTPSALFSAVSKDDVLGML